QQALNDLREQGWNVRIAIADTASAAWALAHFATTPLARWGEGSNRLLALSIAALRLPDEITQTLAELGIDRIGQLEELPRPSIADRFGALVVERLDQIFGRLPESLVPHRSLPDVEANCSFEYPLERHESVCRALEKLLEQIEEMLRKRQAGARCLE